MKLPDIKILLENDKTLRKVSKDVVFPLREEDKNRIYDMINYLKMSQIEEEANKYNLRAGMGLAYIQIGIPKRIFVIVEELDDGEFRDYIVINPTIISHSEEEIYVGEGEGCLSVNREVEGIVPRFARITVQAYDLEGKPYTIRVREDISVAFQHEIDHLDGILFVDKMLPGTLQYMKPEEEK